MGLTCATVMQKIKVVQQGNILVLSRKTDEKGVKAVAPSKTNHGEITLDLSATGRSAVEEREGRQRKTDGQDDWSRTVQYGRSNNLE